MTQRVVGGVLTAVSLLLIAVWWPMAVRGDDGEITRESEETLARGLAWLARNQGPEGNWTSNDLGLVSTAMLAFLADGHVPGRGRYGENVQRAMDYVLRHAKPSGLLNISDPGRAMYNHGLSTFVLGQAYGMSSDPRLGPALDRALKLIAQTQCGDGGWDYQAARQDHGHDLSLAVMQALALRSAVDSGLEVPPEVVDLAIKSVREHFTPEGCPGNANEVEQKKHPGQFTYTPYQAGTPAMAAAGIVCMQEFGQYDDWRIGKSLEKTVKNIEERAKLNEAGPNGRAPFNDAYTLYYVSQALYQVGGESWKSHYPALRDYLVKSQIREPNKPDRDGMWEAGDRVSGRPGEMYVTAVACFVLAIPNRYLPILQEGKIEGLQGRFGQ
jgi:hypothetical protein